jgi:hypothetical protein
MTDHIPAQWRDRGQIIAGLIAERDNLRREVEQLRAQVGHCDSCPFRGCGSCEFQGGEALVAQAISSVLRYAGASKTAPGVASTNTGSLAHSEAAKPHGRTCI